MPTAALYDIHGNLPALEAVLQEVKEANVDQIVIGGDVVLGPLSKKCINKLLDIQLPVHFILGNCEVAVLEQMAGKTPENFPAAVLKNIRWEAFNSEYALYCDPNARTNSWGNEFSRDLRRLSIYRKGRYPSLPKLCSKNS